MSYLSTPYLDVSPTIAALHETPEAFAFQGEWVRHISSRHDFKFDEGNGKMRLRAECACSQLMIREWQQADLVVAFQKWRVEYWQPLMINREFAAHFAKRSPWRNALVRFTGWLHELALRPERTCQPEHIEAIAPVSA